MENSYEHIGNTEGIEDLIVRAQTDAAALDYAGKCILPYIKWFINKKQLKPFDEWMGKLSERIPYAIESFDPEKHIAWSTFFFRCMQNVVRSEWRSSQAKGREVEAIMAHIDEVDEKYLGITVERNFVTLIEKGDIDAAFNALPLEDRLLLQFRFEDELSISKLSVIYDVSRATIGRRINAAMDAMRKHLYA